MQYTYKEAFECDFISYPDQTDKNFRCGDSMLPGTVQPKVESKLVILFVFLGWLSHPSINTSCASHAKGSDCRAILWLQTLILNLIRLVVRTGILYKDQLQDTDLCECVWSSDRFLVECYQRNFHFWVSSPSLPVLCGAGKRLTYVMVVVIWGAYLTLPLPACSGFPLFSLHPVIFVISHGVG